MKCLNSNQSVKEFNENLKDGLKYGFILSNADDIKLIIELTYNLNYYLTYFVSAYGQEEN